jgi:dTDP-4-dehydrorhamnose reductase
MESKPMNKILVTGSEGFFASRFIEYYKDEYDITALNHSTLDISDEKETIKTIKEIGPDYIVHAAAISDTGACEKNPELSYKVNVVGTANIAKGCVEAGAKLFFLSSDQVYNGNLEAGPYTEEYVVPNTVYGNHKLEAEKAAAKIVQEAVSLRLTWMFSLPERHKKINSNIVWNVTKAAMKKEPLKLPVNEYRGITYVYDLIENFSKMLSLPAGVYNAGSENNLSTYETAKIVLEKLGLSERVNELLIKDEERFRYNRDLRITNRKIQNYNIYFSNTEEAVHKCMKDFLYKI